MMTSAKHIPKVELHLHLDGAARMETIFELAQEKGIDIHASSIEELREKVVCTEPGHLGKFLEAWYYFMPALLGDPDAIERVAYELCETQAKIGVVYFEARYCPQFLANTTRNVMWRDKHPYDKKGKVTPEDVILCIIRGFERGEKDFGVKARSILACIRAHPHWSREILDLAVKYRDGGVVAIDIAGCAHGADEKYEDINIEVFQEAAKLGIHRTVHAGEAGTAENVKHLLVEAVEILCAERIGHGYRILGDEKIYAEFLKSRIHLETCPTSSVLTGAVLDTNWKHHPIIRFAEDGANFSLNTDDPEITGGYLDGEIKIATQQMGLSDLQIWQCQLNAALSCFLPDNEKDELVEKIRKGSSVNHVIVLKHHPSKFSSKKKVDPCAANKNRLLPPFSTKTWIDDVSNDDVIYG